MATRLVPSMSGPAAQVLTCTGPCLAESLGFTLAREHLALNRAALYRAGADAAIFGHAPLTLATLGDVRQRPFASLPNLQLDVKDAGSELTRFVRAAVEASVGGGSSGGVTVVETTPRAWRTPEDISMLAQLNKDCPSVRVVLGTGCVAAMEQGTAPSDLAALFVRDLKQGFSGACQAAGQADGEVVAAAAPHGYGHHSLAFPCCEMAHRTAQHRCAGLIGEIVLTGGAAKFGAVDLAVLEAAAHAQRATGAALMLIVPADRDAHYVPRLLSEQLLERLGLGTTVLWNSLLPTCAGLLATALPRATHQAGSRTSGAEKRAALFYGTDDSVSSVLRRYEPSLDWRNGVRAGSAWARCRRG